MKKFNKNDLTLIWGIIVLISLGIGINNSEGWQVWLLSAVMAINLVVTINKIGRK